MQAGFRVFGTHFKYVKRRWKIYTVFDVSISAFHRQFWQYLLKLLFSIGSFRDFKRWFIIIFELSIKLQLQNSRVLFFNKTHVIGKSTTNLYTSSRLFQPVPIQTWHTHLRIESLTIFETNSQSFIPQPCFLHEEYLYIFIKFEIVAIHVNVYVLYLLMTQI